MIKTDHYSTNSTFETQHVMQISIAVLKSAKTKKD